MADLLASLSRFQERANTNAAVRRIAAGWSQKLVVECRDTGAAYQLDITDGHIADVRPRADATDEPGLLIRGEEVLLSQVFAGSVHPIRAYNDGVLEVYGDQRDQVKLDAISLVIWGA